MNETRDEKETRDGLVRSEEGGVRSDAKRSSEDIDCNNTTPHSSLLTPNSISTPHSSLLTPHRPLTELFPRPGRVFSWNRMRMQLQKEGYEVPKLRQNPTIDRLVWWGFTPFMYSCITVFIFGLLLFVGVRQPVGAVTLYVEGVCIGIIVLYVLFLVLVTGIEFLFGLYVFPEGLETTDDLMEAIKRKEEEHE